MVILRLDRSVAVGYWTAGIGSLAKVSQILLQGYVQREMTNMKLL